MDQLPIVYHSKRLKALLFLLLCGNLAVFSTAYAAVEVTPSQDAITLIDSENDHSFAQLDLATDQSLKANAWENRPVLSNRFSSFLRFYQLNITLLSKRQHQQYLNHQCLCFKFFSPYYSHNIDTDESLKA